MARNNVVIPRNDRLGRSLGTAVFILGIIVLLIAAWAAYSFFTSKSETISSAAVSTSAAPITARLTESACHTVKNLAGLFFMAMIGSMIAGKGLQMFYSGAAQKKPAIVPDDPDDGK